MSTDRIIPNAGYVDSKTLPKGPNGFSLCRYCNKECKPPKRTFCSSACVHEWQIRSNPGYARKQVFKRDKGRCSICGEAKMTDHKSRPKPLWEMDHTIPVSEGGGSCGLENLRSLCRPCHLSVTKELAGRRALAKRKLN